LWIVLDPGLRIQVDEGVVEPAVGAEIVIMRGQKHRLSSTGPRGRVLEVAFGYFDEDDIERFDDAYGRG
ncbi:MAG: mannose-6-phosphate isomerase, partial [Actinomycetota bacterium]